MSSGQIWRCPTCRRTVDLAVFIPQLEVRLARPLTDDDMNDVIEGKHHVCQGEPLSEGPRFALTRYDWRTR